MRRWQIQRAEVTLGGVAALLASVLSANPAGASSQSRASETRHFDLEGHRGTRGLRPENTLAAFGKALQLGVTTLELDTGITKDGVVVVSHERRLSSLECRDTAPAFPGDPQFPYVGSTSKVSDGQLIKDLTLAQIKTLDCGTRHPLAADIATDPFIGTQQSVPGTKMPTLAEVFELAQRYKADKIKFDIETKLDPTLPGDTVDPDTFARAVIAVIDKYGVRDRSMLQTFDWRTLVVAKQVAPDLRRVALAQSTTIFPGTPWTAGLPVTSAKPFDGELADLGKQIGVQVLSINFPDITDALISKVHASGLLVVPWTVNDPADMAKLIKRGVDGLITDYPDRARTVMAANGLALPHPYSSPFDIEAHRGGRADRPENTLASFEWGLDHGVTTLELDTGVTKDGVLVISHDREINGEHCHDTTPVVSGDPLYPYVGKLIKDLTLAQIKTLHCGYVSRYPAGHPKAGQKKFPNQLEMPNNPSTKISTLQELFDFAKSKGNTTVRFNIETKISPDAADTVPYEIFTENLVDSIEANKLTGRAMIQSFDWRTIILAKRLDSRIETVALVWQFGAPDCQTPADECSLEATVGDPTLTSTWTAGLDWGEFQDLGALVSAAQANVVSANWQVHDPNQGTVEPTDTQDPDYYYKKQDPAIFHGPDLPTLQKQYGLKVVPYTVNDPKTIQRLIDLGVDGIIADDVPTLQLVAMRNGLA